MPAAVAIPAAVSLGSSVLGGVFGSHAASSAAKTQQQAAQAQADQWRQLVAQYNPQIQSTAQSAADVAREAASTAGAGVTSAAQGANALLQPYMALGGQSAQTLGQMMAPGGDLNRNFTFADMQSMDPGYQFRIDQANQALARSAAARGGALGGGALRAADQLTQNLASSEYGAAFDRFRAQQGDRFSRFSNLVNMGVNTSGAAGANLMNAANTAGGWNIGAAQYGGNALQNAMALQSGNAMGAQRSIADLMTGGAAAQAAGQVGAANAWSGALGGIANAAGQVGGYYNQRDLLKRLYPNGLNPYSAGGNPNLNLPTQSNPWAYSLYSSPNPYGIMGGQY